MLFRALVPLCLLVCGSCFRLKKEQARRVSSSSHELDAAFSSSPELNIAKPSLVKLRCVSAAQKSNCGPPFQMASDVDVFKEGELIYEHDFAKPKRPTECAARKKVDQCKYANATDPRSCEQFCTDSWSWWKTRSYPCHWGSHDGKPPQCNSRSKDLQDSGSGKPLLAATCSDECGSNLSTDIPEKEPEFLSDLHVFWETCRNVEEPEVGLCCQGKDCTARVEKVHTLLYNESTGEVEGLRFPGITKGPARLFPFIFEERYNDKRFIMSEASRWEPREVPVHDACKAWVERLRKLILRRNLPLLMRWDMNGYFDIFRGFETPETMLGPSLQAPILSMLLNQRVSDTSIAAQIWKQMNRLIEANLLHVGDPDANQTGGNGSSWWSDELDEVLADLYDMFDNLESDVEVLQHSEMGRSLETRKNDVLVRRWQSYSVIALSGVFLLVATGGIAAPIGGSAILQGWKFGFEDAANDGIWSDNFKSNWQLMATLPTAAWLGFGRPSVVWHKHSNANQGKTSADRYGRTQKMLHWIESQRKWIEHWMELDPMESLSAARPHLRIRKDIKKELLCNESDSADASFCSKSEEQFKATLLASWVNLVMSDGGCREDFAFKPESFTTPAAAFGSPGHLACCAKMSTDSSKGQCMVRRIGINVTDGQEDNTRQDSGGLCEEGWVLVERDWAFLHPEDRWHTDRRERKNLDTVGPRTTLPTGTCCGTLATSTDGEFECGVPQCAADHKADREEKDVILAGPPYWGCEVDSARWQNEVKVRKAYCASKTESASSLWYRNHRSYCGQAEAFAICKSRRALCTFYATRKHGSCWGMETAASAFPFLGVCGDPKVERSVSNCLFDLKETEKDLKVKGRQEQ